MARTPEEALVRCAELSGADAEAVVAAARGATMKHPPLTEWAVSCVSELRDAYDEALVELAAWEKVAKAILLPPPTTLPRPSGDRIGR